MPPPTSLRPCATTGNCVSTTGAPIGTRVGPLPFVGPVEAVRAAVRAALRALPRTDVIEDAGLYFRAESRSLIFRFVDDVEVLVDESGRVIHFRSASRVGRSDYGVNLRRVRRLQNEIRRQLEGPTPD